MTTFDKVCAGCTITVNEEGYLTDLSQWTKEICVELAKEEGIDITDRHMDVIEYLQDQQRQEIALTIRKVGKSGVVTIKEFYELFPNGPLKISSKVAGIPKPISCI